MVKGMGAVVSRHCCDDAHVQRKVLSEEVLGSFGSELSSHFLVKIFIFIMVIISKIKSFCWKLLTWRLNFPLIESWKFCRYLL